MPRRRIAACCAAVAVIVACVAVVGLARGEVLDETSLVINQPSGNDYVLRRQAMHREEQADAAARRASLATEQASKMPSFLSALFAPSRPSFLPAFLAPSRPCYQPWLGSRNDV